MAGDVVGLERQDTGDAVLQESDPPERAEVARGVPLSIRSNQHARRSHHLMKSNKGPSDLVSIAQPARAERDYGGQHVWRRGQ